jgi:tetratricopeptide (TPR) repeat protein
MTQEPYEQLVARAVELAKQEKFAEAIDLLRQAIAADDDRIDAHYNLAVAYGLLVMGDLRIEEYFEDHVDEEILLQNAIQEYQRVLEIEPTHVPAHNNLAVIFALHGERELAAQELRCSLDLDPDQPEVLEQLTELEGA